MEHSNIHIITNDDDKNAYLIVALFFQAADEIPVAGGTVFVRQKSCVLSNMNACDGTHEHIRRFMIPKNAYQVAAESLDQLQRLYAENEAKKEQRARSAVISKRKSPDLAGKRHRYRPKSSLTVA